MTANAPLPAYLQTDPDDAGGCLLHIKAVPGARRDEIAGPLGERLKVRVSAPPEGGKANKAICALVAERLGVRAAIVNVLRGQTSAEKTLRIGGMRPEAANARLQGG